MRLIDKINSVFHNFVTSGNSLNIEEVGRRKLFIVFLMVMNLGLMIFGTSHLIKGHYKSVIIDFTLIIILIFFVILTRYLKNVLPIFRLTTLLLAVVLCHWVRTGGATGYSGIWGFLFPLFSFFLLGKREGLIWTVFFIISITFLFSNPFSIVAGYYYPAQYISRYMFLFMMILLFTYNYESIREKYKSAMETEQSKLILEKEKAEKINRLLNFEITLREQAEIELRSHHDHLEEIVTERTIEIQKNSGELEASEKRYRLMAENVNDMIWATDLNLIFSFISPSVYRIYGYTVEEAMKLPPDKWNTQESFNRLIKAYQKEMEQIKSDPEKHIILQLDQIKKDGTVFPVELKVSSILDENGAATGIVGITRDISERIAMELEREKIKEQLAQSQKMEALGTLVGGLAHDFNNFLSGIIGSFDLISLALKKEQLNRPESIEKYLQLGIESSKRSAGLIDQLLILSKRHEIKLSPLDIKNSLNHIYELSRNSFPKSIELKFSTEASPLIIMGDAVQIEQVLLNLCINASHAMTSMRSPDEKQGGVLSVTADKIRPDFIMKDNFPEAADLVDHWVRIKVSDTGVGIADDAKQRIFEPFFSTKNKNESSGLGLAITYNIMKKHGGMINVYSESGSGSCFSLYFPAYDDSDTICQDENERKIVCGSGTVLVIDDEPVILSIAEGFLEQCGYDVITAEGAEKGIEIYRMQHPLISAVLIDLSMPGKSGLEVFQELKKIDPDVKAILSSGMLDNESKEIAFDLGVKETVNKPYMAMELSMKLKIAIA